MIACKKCYYIKVADNDANSKVGGIKIISKLENKLDTLSTCIKKLRMDFFNNQIKYL